MTTPAPRPAPAVDLPVLAWAACMAERPDTIFGDNLDPASPMPASLRRRVTAVGRRGLEAAWAVLAGRAELRPRIILSSRHGEYARTVGLLRSLADAVEVSPAEFSLAVHHGLAGLLSIATGNRQGHTAIAAGADTLGTALIEAAACLDEDGGPVLVMHFDEGLPPEYGPADADPCLALALLLGGSGKLVRLSWRPLERRDGTGAASALLTVLEGAAGEVEAAGDRMVWSIRRAA